MVSTTRRRRPALIALVIVAAAGCLALAWWQWTRFESASGTLPEPRLRPAVAAVRRLLSSTPTTSSSATRTPRREPTSHDAVTEIPAGLLPERPKPATPSDDDPALREYNAYLADLAKKDKEHVTETMTAAPTTPVETIRKALLGYRVMAWTTGIWLIALCYEMVMKYVFNVEGLNWIARRARLGVLRLPALHRQPRGQGALADRQDHRRAAGRHHPAGRHHRRALPDQGHQGQVRHLSAKHLVSYTRRSVSQPPGRGSRTLTGGPSSDIASGSPPSPACAPWPRCSWSALTRHSPPASSPTATSERSTHASRSVLRSSSSCPASCCSARGWSRGRRIPAAAADALHPAPVAHESCPATWSPYWRPSPCTRCLRRARTPGRRGTGCFGISR